MTCKLWLAYVYNPETTVMDGEKLIKELDSKPPFDPVILREASISAVNIRLQSGNSHDSNNFNNRFFIVCVLSVLVLWIRGIVMAKNKHSKNKSTTRIRLPNELIEKANHIAKVYDISLQDAIDRAVDDTFYGLNQVMYSTPHFSDSTHDKH